MNEKKNSSPYIEAYKNFKKIKKYFKGGKQIVEEFRKYINEYKDITREYLKKLSTLNSNITKILNYDEQTSIFDKNERKDIIDIIAIFSQILSTQINGFDLVLKGYEKEEKKYFNTDENDSIKIIKYNLNYNKKQIEKNMIDYYSEHSHLMKTFQKTEETIKDYLIKLRYDKNILSNNEKYKQIIFNTKNEDKKFKKFYENFDKNNSEFFSLYDICIEKIKSMVLKDLEYIYHTIIPLILTLENFHKTINLDIENLIQNLPCDEKENYFNKYFKENFPPIKMDILKEKYKIKSISERITKDKINIKEEDKSSLNKALEEYGYDFVIDDNLNLTEEELYSLVKIFYDNFEFIDHSEYNLKEEKEKIEVIKLFEKLVVFGLKRNNLKEYENISPITEEEIIDLYNKIKAKKSNRRVFLLRLNEFRASGGCEIPEKGFEILEKIFLLISDILNKEKDFKCAKLIIILSQTFYKIKEEKKYYLHEILKNHSLFESENLWSNFLIHFIEKDIKKTKSNLKLINLELNKEKIEERYKNIVFAHLLSFSKSFTEFGKSGNYILKIIDPFISKYNFTTEMKEAINLIINKN